MTFIGRRSLLQRAFLLTGATLAPGFTIEALAQAASQAPQLLDTAQFALLSAVSDTIVPRTDTPGALDAGVPKSVDALLRNWASPTRRADLIAALEAIDKHALAEDKKHFAELAPARRLALLTVHDAAALKPPAGAPAAAANALPKAATVADPNYGKVKQEPAQTKQAGEGIAIAAGPVVTDPAYSKLKELIVTLYYTSEPALTHELSYEHAPGAWQPSIPITPETRPSGGIGPI